MTEASFQPFHFTTDDGLKLYGRDYGGTISRPLPVVCLPGLSRNSRDFHQLAMQLSEDGYRVVTLDYRGRGQSAWDANKANYNAAREGLDVITALGHLGIGKATFIGTSRGGLILHLLAQTSIERIAAVVLNDIGPVIEVEGLRRIRDYLSNRRDFTSQQQVAAALESIHGNEFPIFSERDWLDMAEALYRQSDGKWVGDFDPALVDMLKAMDMSGPLPDLWKQYDVLAVRPLLVIRGENSTLLSTATVEEMLRRHPGAYAIIARGQGHAPILHPPAVYAELAAFLDRIS